MKKIVSIILIIASLFTLSSNILSCGAEENSKVSEFKTVSNINAANKKESKEEKIKKFLSEKGSYFPEDKLKEIETTLMSLNDDELEKILKVNFYFPDYRSFLYFESIEQKFINDITFIFMFFLGFLGLGFAGDIIFKNITDVATMTVFKTCYVATKVWPLYLVGSKLYSLFKSPSRIKQANFEYFVKLTGEK